MSTSPGHPSPILTLPQGEKDPLSIRAKALVFADPRSRQLLDYLQRVGPSEAPVLINGETGTGKELVARYIHSSSGRSGAFVPVNCGAISETLAESEFFGHEAGAFSGAVGRRAGWFEEADGGTLFLDEIGDLPLPLQVKLLRALQEQEIVRVGSRKPIKINIRLVTATNIDLEQAVEAGNFRLDLFYRINVAQVQVLPLRERPLDILPLVEHFRKLYSLRLKISEPMLSEAATQALLDYPWPGNIRELENVVHLALLVAGDKPIRPEHLKFSAGLSASRTSSSSSVARVPQDVMREQLLRLFEVPGETLLHDIEDLIVREAFAFCGFNQLRTAELLGITRNAMRTLLVNHGMLKGRVKS
ncbi:sigma-54 interaction domain-containing protein [Pseudomonas gingeri]|uniref:sigma-54 interaction domain-containing protein n=1 Tax=Pseudomonas gingeri TaxID=117681 RepID=UPI0015A3D491|nr:sigma-54 dependent transcriptional regulator [Pseudomonas gingeri]NVZ66371.1 sigma-54-dependent Fis family transcriptional regulator [Pseudomonas gingeri]NVZ76888.1 sigma-54-dependent Fis family transcriptional regulator [Pseudomonas gingeri]NWE71299.1 sigma-54-dependent Fis family transcriptional regulator [Pseudomonas gingeri]